MDTRARVRQGHHQVGAWGLATVVIGIHTRDDAIDSREPLQLIFGGNRTVRLSGTRPLYAPPIAEVTVDLAFAETFQQRLSISHVTLSSLMQWFGIAEPAQITAEGELVALEWWDHRMAEDWARLYGVPVRGS